MRTHVVMALAALAVLLFAAGAAWWPADAPPAPRALMAPPAGPADELRVAPHPAPPSVARAAPTTVCAGQPAQVTHGGRVQHVCLGRALLRQSGDVRTWRAASQPAGWQLAVETSGPEVLAVQLSGPSGGWGCEGATCGAAALGERDTHGARLLSLHGLRLSSPAGPAQLEVTLALGADHEDRSCDEAAIEFVAEGRSAWPFCTTTVAVALQPDGRRLFHLRSLAGDVLEVTLAGDGSLQHIRSGGWECERWHCSGAGLQAAADGGLQLQFDGVALQGSGGVLRLRGRVALPAT